MGPLVAAGGTPASILVPDTTSNRAAGTPLNTTAVAPRKWVPVRVTLVPTGPSIGTKPVTVGASPTVIATISFEKAEEAVSLKACTR